MGLCPFLSLREIHNFQKFFEEKSWPTECVYSVQSDDEQIKK